MNVVKISLLLIVSFTFISCDNIYLEEAPANLEDSIFFSANGIEVIATKTLTDQVFLEGEFLSSSASGACRNELILSAPNGAYSDFTYRVTYQPFSDTFSGFDFCQMDGSNESDSSPASTNYMFNYSDPSNPQYVPPS